MSWFSKKDLIPADEQARIVECIKAAELKTTAEVRVYVEAHCAYVDPLERAKEIFVQLAMDQTEKRNAVIIYIAIKDKQFALFGDTAIYELAGGPRFWEAAAQTLVSYLKQGKVGEGIGHCIDELSNAMAQFFPYDPNITKNELPDEIVFGK